MTLLLLRILALAGQILSALGIVTGLVQKTAQEHLAFQIESNTTNTQLAIQNLLYGLDAAYAQRVDIIAKLVALQASVTAIPTTPQLASNPVTLPSSPPAGYGGPAVDDVAYAVWTYVNPNDGQETGADIATAGVMARNFDWLEVGLPSLNNMPWLVSYPWASQSPPVRTHGIVDPPDASTILPTDATATDWLNRIGGSPGYYTTFDQYPRHYDGTSGTYWTLLMTQEDFERLRALVSPIVADTLPLWPGLAAATPSASHAIAPGLTITEPMDGVIVRLTGLPTKSSFYTFDDINSYRSIGALSFFTDDGEQELAQSLGFTSAIYTPKTMVRAAGVKLRAIGGVSGTVVPWIKTA